MLQKIKVVLDATWKTCPHCKGQTIGALKNGYQLEGALINDTKFPRISTDLMMCFDCKKLYIILPNWFFKGRPRKKTDYPKDVVIEVDETLVNEIETRHKDYLETRAIYEKVIKEGPVEGRDFDYYNK